MTTKFADAYAEWDDQGQAWRVYLIQAQTDAEAVPLRRAHGSTDDNPQDKRLFSAAYLACASGIVGTAQDEFAAFKSRTVAERAAKAVRTELKRIKKGEPGPSAETVDMVAQLTMAAKRGRRR